jgi:dihydroxyacetone kinase-like protein
MGPLYGLLFRGLAEGCQGQEVIDAAVFGRMLAAGVASLRSISQAKVGDKTLMDVLLPAEEAYRLALQEGKSFAECLQAMATAAEKGRDSTRDLVARVGRASRLGERSKGSLDAGAASCALILSTMAGSIRELLAAAR